MPLGPAIRLVKGAYRESPNVAYPKKKDVGYSRNSKLPFYA